MSPELFRAVETSLRRAATEELLPRFRHLGESEVHDKGVDDLVTDADLAAEALLTHELAELLPESSVVGEEACDRDAQLLRRLDTEGYVWVIDPLDGTKHFAAGVPPFGIMVTLCRAGRAEAGWIYLPLSAVMVSAVRGDGAKVDGRSVTIPPAPAMGQARGAMLTRFVPEPLRTQIEMVRPSLQTISSHQCAAQRYVDILRGKEHFALYYRTLPWDHAAGALVVEEAGGVARRFDGQKYEPASDGSGLLVAASPRLWGQLQEEVLGRRRDWGEVPS